jgi:hypothetical protein
MVAGMTDDLLAFVEARIGEDELWAFAASAPYHGNGPTVAGGMHWRWGVGGDWEEYKPDPLEQCLGENDSLSGDVSLVTVEEWPYAWRPSTTDPGQVLSLDDAVRTADAAHIARHDPARVLADVESKRGILAAVKAGRVSPEVLPFLALPYAGHPDYRSNWAPSAL